MYSTKLVNKNFVDGNAYTTIGDPYFDPKGNPFRQPKKGEKVPTPFRIKLKPTNSESGNFSKLTYGGGGFQEINKYMTSQPLDARKKGFGTKDAHRRDEFSNTIRTEQYRETLGKEAVLTQKNTETMSKELQHLMMTRAQSAPTFTSANMSGRLNASSSSSDFSYDSQVSQFDIGRARVTPFDPRSIKDTFYKFNGERDKRFGTFRPTSYDVGDAAWSIAYKPPPHGGKSEVKNFFDKSHLTISPL